MSINSRALTTALSIAGLMASGLAFGQSAAGGAEASQAFRVEFAAPEGCGNADQFSEEILKRTDRLRPAEGREAALGFFVHLTRTPDGVRGQFAIRDVDGALALRDVPGHDCPEVLSAMALIAALTVDPLASADREVPVEARRKLPKPAVKPAPKPPARPASERPQPDPEPEFEKPKPPGAGYGFAVGQRVTVQSAVMPGTTLGLAAHVEAASKATDLFAPMLRVGAVVSRSGTVRKGPGAADFDWITARVSACPVRFGSDRALSARPCAFIDAGRLHGVGSEITPDDEKSVFWAAAGAELTASARLVGPLRIGADAGILVPIRRDRFIFEPDTEIHQPAAVGFYGGIGLGLLFF